MAKLTKQYLHLEAIKDQLDEIIGQLEEKRDAIEERALDRDRDMTEREQERYDALDNQIVCIQEAIGGVETAMYQIEEFWAESC